jgi:hypothetical protein
MLFFSLDILAKPTICISESIIVLKSITDPPKGILTQTSFSSFKAPHFTSSKQLKGSQMEVANAIWLAYLLGNRLTLIEDLGAPACFYASCNV